MDSLEVIEPIAVQEIFVDGFTKFEVHDGILSCVGYRNHKTPRGPGAKVVTIKIVMPVVNLRGAIAEATAAAQDLRIDPRMVPLPFDRTMS